MNDCSRWHSCMQFTCLAFDVVIIITTSSSKNFDKRPHRRFVTPPPRRRMDSSDIDPNQCVVSLAHTSQLRSLHLDRFNRLCVHRIKGSQFFLIMRTIRRNCPFPWGFGPPFNALFPAQPESTPKRHIDQFSRIAGLTNVINRQTHRQSSRPRYSVCSNRPLLLVISAMRPNNNTKLQRR